MCYSAERERDKNAEEERGRERERKKESARRSKTKRISAGETVRQNESSETRARLCGNRDVRTALVTATSSATTTTATATTAAAGCALGLGSTHSALAKAGHCWRRTRLARPASAVRHCANEDTVHAPHDIGPRCRVADLVNTQEIWGHGEKGGESVTSG